MHATCTRDQKCCHDQGEGSNGWPMKHSKRFFCAASCPPNDKDVHVVCSKKSDCRGAKYKNKDALVCCYTPSKNRIAPGWCVPEDECKNEIDGRCFPPNGDVTLNCASGVCCTEVEGQALGFCRTQCKKKKQVDLGCGVENDCKGKTGTPICCHSTQPFRTAKRKCSATECTGTNVDVAKKDIEFTTSGLGYIQPDSVPSILLPGYQIKLRHKMTHFSEAVSRLISDEKSFQAFVEYKKKHEILDKCDTAKVDAQVLSHHIVTTLLIPLSNVLLGEVSQVETLYKAIVGPTESDSINKRIVQMLSGGMEEADAETVVKLLSTGFMRHDELITDWVDFNEQVANVVKIVEARCEKYADDLFNVYKTDSDRTKFIWPPNAHEIAHAVEHHSFARFQFVTEVVKIGENVAKLRNLTSVTGRDLTHAEYTIVRAFEGTQQCKDLWAKVHYGIFYFKKALEAEEKTKKAMHSIGQGIVNALGSATSALTFGASAVAAKTLTTVWKLKAEASMEKTKKSNELFFEVLAERQKDYRGEAVDMCFVSNVDLLRVCYLTDDIALTSISPTFKTLCDELKHELETLAAAPAPTSRTAVAKAGLAPFKCLKYMQGKAKTFLTSGGTDPFAEIAHPTNEDCDAVKAQLVTLLGDPANTREMKKNIQNGRTPLLPSVLALRKCLKRPHDPACAGISAAAAKRKELYEQLNQYRTRIKDSHPGLFSQLPTMHNPNCNWNGMFRAQLEDVKELLKDASSMMLCRVTGSDDARKANEHLEKVLGGGTEEFGNMMAAWESAFTESDWETVVEIVLTLVEGAADAAKDLVDKKWGIYDKYIKNVNDEERVTANQIHAYQMFAYQIHEQRLIP